MTRAQVEATFAANPSLGRKKLSALTGCSLAMAQRVIRAGRVPSAVVVPKPAEARVEVENRQLRQLVKEQSDHIARLSIASELLDGIASAQLEPPKWILGGGGKTHRSIATAVLADTHFDEVVNPSEIGYVNAYNREIAQLRLREFFSNTVKLGSKFFSGITVEGITLVMAGDIVAGEIHEELAQTNASAILDTCLFWSEEIAAGIEQLLAFYGKAFVPCVVGNHGRLSRKPRHKGRVRDNFDYLIYSLVARHFKDDERVTFLIPDTSDAHFKIYDTAYCLTHGDQFRGGTGIAGALSPLLLGDARKRKRSTATNKSYDYLVLGHWHQSLDAMGIICCNTLKGMDEYAMNNNFAFSEPSQSFWLTDADKGRTIRAPIHVRSAAERGEDVECQTQPGWLQT